MKIVIILKIIILINAINLNPFVSCCPLISVHQVCVSPAADTAVMSSGRFGNDTFFTDCNSWYHSFPETKHTCNKMIHIDKNE